MKTNVVLVLVLLFAPVLAAAHEQAPPPAKPPAAAQPPATQAPPPQKPKPAARPSTSARLTMMVFVTDTTGAPVPGAEVSVSGPITREGVTGKEGNVKLQGLRAGQYRLHLEAKGFVTLEKEVTVRSGVNEVEASLTRAPAPPPAPEPPPAPKPTTSAVPPLPPPDPNATIEVMSVVDWLAKNKLERGEPRKEGVVARAAGSAAALLQVRDALRDRSHGGADEVIYVINGSATLSSQGRQRPIETGSLFLVPHGVTFTIENRGREPLWALSVLSPGQVP
jgi:mannose-6-phosphate isomerase-like protein (cupin superfamily)